MIKPLSSNIVSITRLTLNLQHFNLVIPEIRVSIMSLPQFETKRLSKDDLTQDDIEYFTHKYGKKFVKALRTVEEGKIIRFQFSPSESVTWIAKGRGRQYLIIPELYCTCRSFYQEVVISRETNMCYHLLAQKIAEIREEYRTQESTDTERRKLYVEWRRTD
jgi:predicted nucleic acid-binding Zn finger protein